MLNFDQIDKLATAMEAAFREENEGKYVVLKAHNRSGPIRFEFDMHIQEFRLTTDRNNDISLLIYIVCKNGKFGYDEPEEQIINGQVFENHDCVRELSEDPILEYYENLTNDRPGKFEFSNLDQVVLSPSNCSMGGHWIEDDQHRVQRIFDTFENQLNADSTYNINLSKLVFSEELEAAKKAKELADAEAAKEAKKAARKEARKEAVGTALDKTRDTATQLGVAALIGAGVIVAAPFAPLILLGGCLWTCLEGLDKCR